MKFFISKVGCHLNSIDTNRIKYFMIDNHWEEIENFKEADMIIFNTCAFIKSKIKENISLIKQVDKEKKKNATFVVCGCLPVIAKQELKDIKDVICLSPHNLSELDNIIKAKKSFNLQPTAQKLLIDDEICKNRDIFFIRTNYGCVHQCSFCAIKKVFPKLISKSLRTIIKEFEMAIQEGSPEIGLTAEDLTAYGKDIQTDLIELLEKIIKIEGDYKLSLYRLYPQFLLTKRSKFLDLLNSNKFNYLSIPVNSGSQKILKLMGREYDVKNLMNLMQEIKGKYPLIKIRNDIMVGHPGETEEDFNQTLDFVINSNIDILVVFPFCAMPGTRAVKMGEKVPQSKITSRLGTLNEIFEYKKKQKSTMKLSIEKSIIAEKETEYFRLAKRLRIQK